MNELVDDRWMDKWMDGRMDDMYGCIFIISHLPSFLFTLRKEWKGTSWKVTTSQGSKLVASDSRNLGREARYIVSGTKEYELCLFSLLFFLNISSSLKCDLADVTTDPERQEKVIH